MTGRLGLFSLVDLLQLLAGAGRSGRLLVRHPRGDARIYVDEGDVVHAEFDDLEGEEAVYALFADEQGEFEFKNGLPAPAATVELGTQNLILEAVRRLDEARRDSGDDGPALEPDMVPERAPERAADRLALGAPERAVLAQVDDRRSLGRIAELAGLPVDEAARVTARLMAAGVLLVRRRRPRTARLVVRPDRGGLPAGVGAVDAGIVDAWARALGGRPREVLCRREDGTVERLHVVAREGVGPYLLLGREALMRTGLRAQEALLVRPVEEELS
jgi:hypothetical protein